MALDDIHRELLAVYYVTHKHIHIQSPTPGGIGVWSILAVYAAKGTEKEDSDGTLGVRAPLL